MDHYIDLRLRPDPDFPPAMLMGALYGRLHRALFDQDANDIGVSFPDHKTGVLARTPGDRLRLHGQQQSLAQLMAQPWLAGMRELVEIGEILLVPDEALHRVVRRRQFKTGNDSQVKRYARRHAIDIEEAQARFARSSEPRITLPFVSLSSRSSGQRFALFIEHGQPQAAPVAGRFNHYGLSRGATVPWF
ncbi:type I-F CRISPR-associated endoribonuclease Cas6/Csy4 [Modicisalibacter radicis]|uniref:type I-F CRISPR-associated endoribonuclease Cas6/Csy4 n=1 Tax=Halomonas sp. EAR18 TaxID=2518972 RepID=UPI00109CA613|nr:type I-F CRISPR-associated endoribonuclease Cas6/Csy4 [Halomonas sp. EAR18]